MAIVDTLESIKTHLGEAYTVLEEKEATIPENKNIENLADSILSIEQGGGVEDYFTETISADTSGNGGWINTIKKMPPLKNSGTSCQYMFANYKLESLDLINFDTSRVINMSNMFQGNNKKYTIKGFEKLDVSNVTNFSNMFYACNGFDFDTVKNDIANWNFNKTSNINCSYMFAQAMTLNSLDTSKWEFNLGSFSRGFYGCSNLSGEIDFSNINCDNADFNNCFVSCSKLGKIKMGYTTTQKTNINCSYLCAGCSLLKEFDASNMEISYTNINYAPNFNNCRVLEKIDIRKMTLSNLTSAITIGNVPTTCLIIVKDENEKTWWNSKSPTYTNIKTVAEYEG